MLNRQLLQELEEERKTITKIIQDVKKETSKLPSGHVEVRRHGKSVQFYHRENSKSKNGVYIPAADRQKAIDLVQKRYLLRLLSIAGKQEKVLDAFLRSYDNNALMKAYDKEGKLRQPFITPVLLPDPEFAAAWQATEYQGKPIREDTPVHFTQKQERVRSKSEVMIANALFRSGIPYRYECPLYLRNQVIYPDFTVLRMRDRKQVYWEHLGLIDDLEYRNHALQRIRLFEENGIFPGDELILTVETYKMPLNSLVVKAIIQHYLL